MKSFLKYGWGAILVIAVIFYLSCMLQPSQIIETEISYLDKIVHFGMYFFLSFVASFQYIYLKKGRIIVLKLVVFAIVVPILFGGLIELLQGRYFGRTADIFDFLADFAGSFAVLPFALKFRRNILNRNNI